MPEVHTPKAAYTPREFCAAHGIGLTNFYALVKRGDLRPRKVGSKKIIVLREEAERWAHALPPARD